MALNTTFLEYGSDGAAKACQTCRKTIFKDDAILAATDYSVLQLPKGFIPVGIAFNVIDKAATANTLTVKKSTDGASASAIGATCALATEGLSYVAIETPAIVTNDTTSIVFNFSAAYPAAAAKFDFAVVGYMPTMPGIVTTTVGADGYPAV